MRAINSILYSSYSLKVFILLFGVSSYVISQFSSCLEIMEAVLKVKDLQNPTITIRNNDNLVNMTSSSSSSDDDDNDDYFILKLNRTEKTTSTGTTTNTTTTTNKNKDIPTVATTTRSCRLEFLHIPKTAGSAIYVLAGENNISWGYCHFSNDKSSCPQKSTVSTNISTLSIATTRALYGVSPWHLPIQYFNIIENMNNENKEIQTISTMTTTSTHISRSSSSSSRSSSSRIKNPYKDDNVCIFTIVRNPYTRLISDHYYWKRKRRNIDFKNMNNPKELNRKISTAIRKSIEASIGSKEYFKVDSHYIPQYHYIYNITPDTINNNNYSNNNNNNNNHNHNQNNNEDDVHYLPVVDYVLKFEDFPQNLFNLLKEHGLGHWNMSSFENTKINQAIEIHSLQQQQESMSSSQLPLTVANFTKRTLDLINEYYKLDFEHFGYEKVIKK